MEHGEAERPPVAGPLADPVPLPMLAADLHWQHVLLENRLQTERRVVGTQEPRQKRWAWALLLSCPQPIASFRAIDDLPRGSIVTALLAGEVRDLASLRDVLTPSTRTVIDKLPLVSAPETLTLTLRDGTSGDGVCLHLSNDPGAELRTGGAIGWEAFEDGRAQLLGR